MTYEISLGRRDSLSCKDYPFVTNVKTRKRREIELSDLIPIGTPIRYAGLNHYRCSDKRIEVIMNDIPEDANAFHDIAFWLPDPGHDAIVQYYQVRERFHEVSNLP